MGGDARVAALAQRFDGRRVYPFKQHHQQVAPGRVAHGHAPLSGGGIDQPGMQRKAHGVVCVSVLAQKLPNTRAPSPTSRRSLGGS